MNPQLPISTLTRPDGLNLKATRSPRSRAVRTPTYVYSRQALTQAFDAYRDALSGRRSLVCYAVKANSNLGVLSAFAKLGAGFDIVSGGELARVLAAGGDPGKVVFSGVGKSEAEMRQALGAGIRCFNVESEPEIDRLNAVAGACGKVAPIALRVNPDVDPKTHPYISTGLRNNKFGVAFDAALALYRHAAKLPHLRVSGIACHIGSQLLDRHRSPRRPKKSSARRPARGRRHPSRPYRSRRRPRHPLPRRNSAVGRRLPRAAAAPLRRTRRRALLRTRAVADRQRRFAARARRIPEAGAEKSFAIVDAAMNDLARPALYDAYHEVVAVTPRDVPLHNYEIVGPICESGDFLAHDRDLAVAPGDLVALLSAGAYGMAMSSNYNTRPRAAEVIVDGATVHLVRERETVESLYALESPLR